MEHETHLARVARNIIGYELTGTKGIERAVLYKQKNPSLAILRLKLLVDHPELITKELKDAMYFQILNYGKKIQNQYLIENERRTSDEENFFVNGLDLTLDVHSLTHQADVTYMEMKRWDSFDNHQRKWHFWTTPIGKMILTYLFGALVVAIAVLLMVQKI